MAENKTKPTGASVDDYLASRANERQAADCRALIRIMQKATRRPPYMWGPSIVGFGNYRYTYPSGRTGEAPLAAFAIRGRELVVYVDVTGDGQQALLSRVGPHRMGKVCLYFRALADLDVAALEQLVTASIAATEQRHGRGDDAPTAERRPQRRAAKAPARKPPDPVPMRGLFHFAAAVARCPAVERWLAAQDGERGQLARTWFAALRACGKDVRELLHDGHPTACCRDAAFAYVSVHAAHVNVGFFHGAALPDPAGLLQGTGKYMRHVRLGREQPIAARALKALIAAAYRDVRARARAER